MQTEAFPSLSDAYARWRADPLGRITDALEQAVVLDLLGNVAGRRVLDIGCGDGELAVRLASLGASVTGLDASATMIAAARRRAQQAGCRVEFCIGRAEMLPFRPQAFDLVVGITVLCFLPRPAELFGEASRVLAPGGRLVIGELGRASTWAAQRRLRAWLGDALWRRARFRTAPELRRLAREAGLQPATVRGAVYFPRSLHAARLLRSLDPRLGKLTTCGAAFLAMSATKQ